MRLLASGYGQVSIGMSWADALATGVQESQDVDGCQVGAYRGTTIYGKDGAVTAVVAQDRWPVTVRGIAIGSTRFEVVTLYPTAVELDGQATVREGQHELVFGFRGDAVVYMRAQALGGGPGC